jgi:hypothetical protein
LAKPNETDRKATAWPTADRPFPELASALRSQANQIVQAWAGAVRAAIPPATDLPSDELQDHLPGVITKTADAMDSVARHNGDGLTQRSRAQELTRRPHRYDVRALMTEDRLLRRVIIERVKVALGRQLTPAERVVMNARIDNMLEEEVRAQNGWADHLRSSSKHEPVVVPNYEASPAQPDSGDERAGDTVAAVLDNPDGFSQPVVRVAAVTALQEFKSPQAAPDLNAVAADVNDDPVPRAASAAPAVSVEITHESIAVAAYYIWENNGRRDGSALEDWLQAEVRLTAKREASGQSH